jgi:predicted AlkP superfamily phosphohydrolase/phosphomutase
VGIDAAEPSIVRALLESGNLPNLAGLLQEGAWGRVTSPADVGSGCVWPTFSTGEDAPAHGIHSLWSWDPQAMRVNPTRLGHLRPFWVEAEQRGYTVGVLDVPFAPPVGLDRGFEVLEWGTHDWVRRRTFVGPRALPAWAKRATKTSHPFARRPLDYWASIDDEGERASVALQCVSGARQRGDLAAELLSSIEPDLAVIIFSEVHRASHLLWHTLDQGASVPTGPLVEVYREVDVQLGRLVATTADAAAVLVFSLHGMRPGHGVPTILAPLLHALGLTSQKAASSEQGPARARRAATAVRRMARKRLRGLYDRVVPAATALRLAGPPDPLPQLDWPATTAFALPTDQHGWIRLNLAGRESQGSLPLDRYEAVCHELKHTLLGLRDDADRPLVESVLLPGVESGLGSEMRLPDLVIHWSAAAEAGEARVHSPAICAGLRGSNLSGQHAPDGFYVARNADALTAELSGTVDAAALKGIFMSWLTR